MMLTSVEKLQLKQSELQEQLDGLLAIARSLETKQRRKLNNIVNNPESDQALDDADDEELVEFQQIENELKVTELNRQLSNIQEELRLTLFKMLLSSTTTKSNQPQSSKQPIESQNVMRRNSTQTEESTPSSSSCSDEQTATSSCGSNNVDSQNHPQQSNISANSSCYSFDIDAERPYTDHRINQSPNQPKALNQELHTIAPGTNIDTNIDACKNTSASIIQSQHNNDQNANPTDIDSIIEQIKNYEISSPFQSQSNIPRSRKLYNQNVQYIKASTLGQYHVPSASFIPIKRPTANQDMERIDEGERDDQENYCNSAKLRTIYEEKLSPIIQAGFIANQCPSNKFCEHDDKIRQTSQCMPQIKPLFLKKHPDQIEEGNSYNNLDTRDQPKSENSLDKLKSPEANYDKFNPDNVNSARRCNRPLTIYLPRPDDKIDLVEHVQALGHDINIVSSDLKLTPKTASGYLYKSCSKNTKWLKRLFFFDQDLKRLSYYESEEQLVKKNCPRKSIIPFDEICDVYVDHSLSRVSEKQKSSKRTNYVFVLSTIKRKYNLSTPRAETMRAWIDILFTAAKANDYFQHLEEDKRESGGDESSEAQSMSIVER